MGKGCVRGGEGGLGSPRASPSPRPHSGTRGPLPGLRSRTSGVPKRKEPDPSQGCRWAEGGGRLTLLFEDAAGH